MSNDFSAFYTQNAGIGETEDVVVSQRFKDKDGKPIPWKIRSITEEENTALRKSCMKRIKGRNGYTNELNTDDYLGKMVAESVIYPDPKDAALQDNHGVKGAESLLRKMLLPGEYSTLLQKVQEINGYDKEIGDLVDDVKN